MLTDKSFGGNLPTHHPSADLLFEHATGGLPHFWAAGIAAHLTYCPHCRSELARLEALGGSLLDEAEADAVLPSMPPRLTPATEGPAPAGPAWLPRALSGLPGLGGAEIAWRRLLPGVEECLLHRDADRRVSLYRVAPGAAVPRHTHKGEELTLVLDGGYDDAVGSFRRGDVEFGDSALEHRPVAMADRACVCFVVTDGALRFRGIAGLILNRFTG
jgi:putative transcriptional regulator